MSDGRTNVTELYKFIMDSVKEFEESKQSEQLDTHTKLCPHFDGGNEVSEPMRLRYIHKRYPEDFRELEDIVQASVGRYIREIRKQNFPPSKKYISEVYCYRDNNHRDRLVQHLRDGANRYPGRLLIWVDEGDHMHTVHDCPFSNGQCRCFVFKSEDFRGSVRKPMRYRRYIRDLDNIDWTNILIYFIMQKRECPMSIWIDGRLQGLPTSDEVVQWQRLQEKCREILGREGEGDGYNPGWKLEDDADRGELIPEGTSSLKRKRSASEESGSKRKKSKYTAIRETVEQMVMLYFPCPIKHLRDLLIDDDDLSDTLFDPANKDRYRDACVFVGKKFNRKSLKELREMYEQTLPVFYGYDKNPFVYYHTREESLEYVDNLLRAQIGDEEHVQRFLVNIRDWFDKKGWNGNPKMMAVSIIGPPNSGKNYFWDMLAALACNTGHIGRVCNKVNQFSLQECASKRLVIGNELSIDDNELEDFKKLCEGAAFNINVKHQGDAIHTRCPVILISNNIMDMCTHHHFVGVRLHVMRWHEFGFLKGSGKKPYPMCVFDLFDKYNIQL